ncbi:hypothetical protein M0R72_14000 [Candidatus Pacearchaeota archaeon]|nr:hypothetical protein [Candidatus Pacearchaeota archaeon]
MDQKAIEMAEAIKKWWIENEIVITGDHGESNTYMKEPPFVALAKEIIGDWEV